MTERHSIWIDSAAALTYVVVGVYFAGKWPEPLGIVVFIVYSLIWWFAVGEYIDRWIAPGVLSGGISR